MIKETVTMSHKELDRLHIIQESLNRHITQEQSCGTHWHFYSAG